MATPAVSCWWDLGQLFLIWLKYHYLLSRAANEGWGESERQVGEAASWLRPPGAAALGQWLWAGASGPGPPPTIAPRAVCGGGRDRKGAPGPAGPGPPGGAATRAQPRRRSHHAALRSSPLNRRAEVIFFFYFLIFEPPEPPVCSLVFV